MPNNIRYFPDPKTGKRPGQSSSELGSRLISAALYLLMGILATQGLVDGFVINLALMMVLFRMYYVQGQRSPIILIILIIDLLYSLRLYLGSTNTIDGLLPEGIPDAIIFPIWGLLAFISCQFQRERHQVSYFMKFHYLQAVVFFVALALIFQLLVAVLNVFGSTLDLFSLGELLRPVAEGRGYIHLVILALVLGPSVYMALGALMGKTASFPFIGDYVRKWT